MIYPLTADLAKAIGDNTHIKLKRLYLFVNNTTYKEQLAAVKASKISNTIRFLDIVQLPVGEGFDDNVDVDMYSDAIVDACGSMPRLYTLQIYNGEGLQFYEPCFLAKLMQKAHHVKVLHFGPMDVWDVNVGMTINVKEAKNQQLRVLSLDIGDNERFFDFSLANKTIDFMLHLCPLLKDFSIGGDLQQPEEKNGVLRFDFSHLEHLQSNDTEMYGLSYYKLNLPGKEMHRWLNMETPYMGPRIDSDEDSNNDDSDESNSDSDSDNSNSDSDGDSDDSDQLSDYIPQEFCVELTWSDKQDLSASLLKSKHVVDDV